MRCIPGLVAVTAVLALAGCDRPQQIVYSPTKVIPTTIHTKPAGTRATEHRYAEIVSRGAVVLLGDIRSVTGGACERLASGDAGQGCSIRWASVGRQARTLSADLTGAETRTSPLYVGGPPPTPIRPLVIATLSSAKALESLPARVATCASGGSTACRTSAHAADTAVRALQRALASWKPYE